MPLWIDVWDTAGGVSILPERHRLAIIFFWRKNTKKMVRVAITLDSRREWRSREATRYWIVASRWTDVDCWNKKLSPARRQIANWYFSFFARRFKKSQADSLIGPSVSTANGWKWQSAVLLLSLYLLLFLLLLTYYYFIFYPRYQGSRGIWKN